jgi:hypothetical protein
VLQALGLVSFASPGPLAPLAPVWIVTLWIAFAGIVRPAFAVLAERPVAATALGVVVGPLAYLGAERLGALALAEPRWLALVGVGVMWGLALPLAVRFGVPSRRSI